MFAEATSAELIRGYDPEVHTFRLISRRLKTHLNSLGGEIPGLASKTSTNYAYMNPADMERSVSPTTTSSDRVAPRRADRRCRRGPRRPPRGDFDGPQLGE